MFNEIQKQEYIDFESTNESALKRYFARIAPKEEEYQKDIVDMDLDEAMDTLKSLKVRREESRGHLLSLIRGYDNWAKLNGKSKNVHVISRIPPEAIGTDDVYLETMIGSPEHLDKIFDDALDYENYENKSKSHELLFRLLYEGMTLEEVQSLKKSDINYDETKVKTIHGTDFIVSDYISRLWKECAVMTYYERKNSRSASAKSTNVNEYSKYELNDSRYLFRTIVGTKSHTDVMMTLDSLRKMILNVFLACEKKTVPARNINYSGIFYKLYMLEREGNSITPEIIADYFRISYNEESNMPTITRKWRIDYEDWKIAFGHMQHQVPE